MERFQGVASQLMNQVSTNISMLPVVAEPTCVQICEQRIIRLGGAVDDDSCNLSVAQLLWLDATDPKQVTATPLTVV